MEGKKVNNLGNVHEDLAAAHAVDGADPAGGFHAGAFWVSMLLVLPALILVSGTVRAHGGSGYYRIAGMEMGDYTVHVWTSPGLLRTGEVHVDTAVFDAQGLPAFNTLVMVTLAAQDGHMPPTTVMAGLPYNYYPFTREARFRIDDPGLYTLHVVLSDRDGRVGSARIQARVQTITGWMKALLLGLTLLSLVVGVWLLLHAHSFWDRSKSLGL